MKFIKSQYFIGLILLMATMLYVYGAFNNRPHPEEDGELIQGTICDCGTYRRGSAGAIKIKVRYSIGDSIIYGYSSHGVMTNTCIKHFLGRTFPVLVSRKYNYSRLLITREDFADFSLPFPDSLKWVTPLVSL
jgi:hypothetical protein